MAVKPKSEEPRRGGDDAAPGGILAAPPGEGTDPQPAERTDSPSGCSVAEPPAEEIDAALQELIQRIRPVVMALKEAGPPPPDIHDAFHDADLGPRHGVVLLSVTFNGELSVSELAERIALSLSTTSLMVGQLSRAGLLERVEDPRDRRRTLVRLNESYREGLTAWLTDRIGPLRRTLQRLTPEQRAGFLEGWRILEEEIDAVAQAPDG
jgi:DNA-binding MarR family transcriptional regulator